METKPLNATTKVRIICPSKAKEPYATVITELSTRSNTEVVFTKDLTFSGASIILDEMGVPLSSQELENLLSQNVDFVVGGPDGFGKTKLSGKKYSLGQYTLNHQIAIIVLLDLIFRVRFPNHPYNSH